ncbi:S-adenosyl-L-methionine-dependent methyltransferase [Pseudomassariella vexata]|uniref:S-adenosyl-L-methionine-dependent methyltransferase n=1 Tax=Pseudomassariella vexata TaxID=1141098 RepID=A0A1Y2EBB5_9PEZI|nr:S-adenosyl-L-methionine-dependent methyltransferase [Pseudomassariella vexata]ORY68594.1 S-adenosyl-L-methionine-dependent methyltransferase [Pseudomassariella vexata]
MASELAAIGSGKEAETAQSPSSGAAAVSQTSTTRRAAEEAECPGAVSPEIDRHTPSNPDSVIEPGDGESVENDEFDPQEWDDNDSCASISLSSSIYQHTYDNGRRFHAYKHGRYPIPNDEREQSREDMKHAMMMEIADGQLHYAPVGETPQKILDLGTGTGIWAIEMGDRYPSATVTGIDLSPIQPVWLPPNVKFVIDDCEDEQTFANLKPGGWMEWQEFHGWFRCNDNTMPPDYPAHLAYKMAKDAFKRLNFDVDICTNMGRVLRDAGFVNVNCIVKKIPVGPWAKDKRLRLVGWYLKTVIQEFLAVLSGKPWQVLGLNEVERELWKKAACRALEDERVHRYWNFYFWYAQKLV